MKRDEYERLIREKVAQGGLTAILEKAVAARVMLPMEHADETSVERAVGEVTQELSALAERRTMTRAERIARKRGWVKEGAS